MYAALHLLDLPVTAALRGTPEADPRLPWAVLAVEKELDERRTARLPLLSVNAASRVAGIDAGWPLNRALVRSPGLGILPRQREEERAMGEELVALGESLTPDLEITGADTVVLDLSWAGNKAPAAFANLPGIRGAVACHALAETPDLARLAVLEPTLRGRVVTPADLAPLPISFLERLEGGGEFLPLMEMWGIHTAGDYLRLPRQELAERLGPQAGAWHDLLHGRIARPLRLHRPPESFAQELDLEDALDGTEPLLFLLKRLLHTLEARLAARHLAACLLKLQLRLATGAGWRREIRLPEPLTEAAAMIRPVQTLVEQLQLDAPVVGVTLDAEATFPGSIQKEWLGRQLPDPARWADTLARLDALLGPGMTGVPCPADSHRADAFRMLPAPGSVAALSSVAVEAQEKPSQPESSLPLRRFRPPHGIAVAHELSGEMPRPLALLSGPHPGRITDLRGPFAHSGQWWEPEAQWKRLEWDIYLTGGRLLRLVYTPPDRWELDGIYS